MNLMVIMDTPLASSDASAITRFVVERENDMSKKFNNTRENRGGYHSV